MRRRPTIADFDLTDVTHIDSLDDVLDLAVNVLREYSDPNGQTRIERMARWLILNVGEVPSLARSAELAANFHAFAWSVDDHVALAIEARKMSPEDARFFAMSILRAAARAEAGEA